MIAEFIYRMFHARTTAHILHLSTRSYAQHKALGDFYDGIVDLADSIAEGYIGEHGLIDFSGKGRYSHETDAVKAISELKEWVEQHRYEAVEAEDRAETTAEREDREDREDEAAGQGGRRRRRRGGRRCAGRWRRWRCCC